MNKIIFGLILLAFVCSLNAQQANKNAEVEVPVFNTSSGQVLGVIESGVFVFKGIPYAAPPVGEYRWRPPQPVGIWKGVRKATTFSASCAQPGWPRGSEAIAEGSSEDCLYLNLWVPSSAKSKDKFPVMVWIHGGGFVGGSGFSAATFGDEFAKRDVILMTFNYRLGRLGHFAFPALNEEYPDEAKGSYAYMDMIAALEWVQENIAGFGGDPNNVTIFGESAGGVAVHSLLTIPKARGLFQKAIIQSGGGRDGVLTARPIEKANADPFYTVSAETIGINFAIKHGIEGTGTDALAQLRSLSIEEIIDGGQESYGPENIPIYSGPILDGSLVVETAERAYKAGRIPEVPLIIGSNSAEVPAGFVNAESKEELISLFGRFKKEAEEVYDPTGKTEFAEILTMVNTDKVWAEPARFTAKAFAAESVSAYVYLFSYVPSSLRDLMPYGASHGSEIPYVFNNLDARWGVDTTTIKDNVVARMMNSYWVNFAQTGDPNGKGLPEWPAYNPSKDEILEFQFDGEVMGKPNPQKEQLDVIEKAAKAGVFF